MFLIHVHSSSFIMRSFLPTMNEPFVLMIGDSGYNTPRTLPSGSLLQLTGVTWYATFVDKSNTLVLGCAMAQVVSHRPLTAEARVRARVNPYGICGLQSGAGTGFSPSSSVFPCQYHSTIAVQTHIIWGMHNMLT
jgi:hypothetical protein